MNSKSYTSLLGVAALAAAFTANASASFFTPGDILVSSSTYSGDASLITNGVSILPNGSNAVANGSYFQVFNNEVPDANFGVTTPAAISELTPAGSIVQTLNVPTNVLVTSFSSKSELGLNLSQDGKSVSFMGYNSDTNQFDISNTATPDFAIASNGTALPTYRVIGQLNSDGSWTNSAGNTRTLVDSYSGNNGRAAILTTNGYYTVGNANYVPVGSQPKSINTGVQYVSTANIGNNNTSTISNNSISLGNFNITQYGYAADKSQKDNNFRGVTVFNNTLYVTKGSGGNGIDTVYQVGAAGTLPTASNNITILPGFDTNLATGNLLHHPFGLYFANASTLYVADEGSGAFADFTNGLGYNAYAGLEKWSLNGGTWQMDYILTNGLNIGQNYTVSGTNNGVAGSYTTATDGLRQLAGQTNADGTVTLYTVSSTANNWTNGSTINSKDAGADPNKLFGITDVLSDTNASQVTGESFTNIESAAYGQVLRGVSFAPVPEPSTWALLGLGTVAALFAVRRKQNS